MLRRQARAIFRAGLAAANPIDAVVASLQRHDFSRFAHIYVVGAGKAGASMAQAAERVLGRRITAGLINVKDGHLAKLRRIELNQCGHPVPDERGVAGAARIAAIATGAGRNDLVLCLISGGASALLPLPVSPITLEEKQQMTRLLLDCGADIHELNAVRKHLSRIKGGQLARLASPARVEALMLSDVIGDDLDTIGSGPTAPDASTFAMVTGIFEKYGLTGSIPPSIAGRIASGVRGEIAETPKAGDPCFARVRNSIVGSNRLALAAAARRARDLGFRTTVLSSAIEGETREIARMHAAIARDARPGTCIVTGGETTVTIKGSGLGGRNQEFVLAAAIDIAGRPDIVVLSAGTDGSDGPTGAAGAIADGDTVRRNPEAARYLAANDSYHYFESLGDLVITGPTNTNVMDIHVILVGAQGSIHRGGAETLRKPQRKPGGNQI